MENIEKKCEKNQSAKTERVTIVASTPAVKEILNQGLVEYKEALKELENR